MPGSICTACGTEFPPSSEPPAACSICQEERQFVPPGGQKWTTLDELSRAHSNCFRQHEPGVLSLRTTPDFAIGQRAFLIMSEHGNILWDCLTLIDEAAVTLVQGLGGISAVAISHPHYYATMNRWAEAFGAKLYLHAADRQWVVNPGPRIVYWEGDSRALMPGTTLVRCGGHFAGGTVLHVARDPDPGILFSGDVLQVLPGRDAVSFMRSYPNLIPLSAPVVDRVVARLQPYRFDRVYGAFPDREILQDGEAAVRRSADRYIRSVSGHGPADAEP